MVSIWRDLLSDERGFVLTAELIIISTVLVLGLVTAFTFVQTSVVAEMKDVGNAIGSLNQSYAYGGMKGCQSWCGLRSRTYGSAFLDVADTAEEQRADFGYIEGYGSAFGWGGFVGPVLPPVPGVVVPGVVVPEVVVPNPCLPPDGPPFLPPPVIGPGAIVPPCVDPWTPGVPAPGVGVPGVFAPGMAPPAGLGTGVLYGPTGPGLGVDADGAVIINDAAAAGAGARCSGCLPGTDFEHDETLYLPSSPCLPCVTPIVW